MQIEELFDSATGFVALGALLGLALLLPLYLSQRRDVRRMRDWMDREPNHPAEDLTANEAILDRAEAELEELMPEELPAAEPTPTPATPMAAATRVTHERPALERITMERAALEPHPRWRRFASRATQPRVLVAIGLLSLLLGGAAILISEEVLKPGDERPARTEAIERSEVTVAVLNATQLQDSAGTEIQGVEGLAAKVADEVVKPAGFKVGKEETAASGFDETTAMFESGAEEQAKELAEAIADQLGDTPVIPMIDEVRELTGGAPVALVIGQDDADF